jgi:hypothetical protein
MVCLSHNQQRKTNTFFPLTQKSNPYFMRVPDHLLCSNCLKWVKEKPYHLKTHLLKKSIHHFSRLCGKYGKVPNFEHFSIFVPLFTTVASKTKRKTLSVTGYLLGFSSKSFLLVENFLVLRL